MIKDDFFHFDIKYLFCYSNSIRLKYKRIIDKIEPYIKI